MGFGDFGSNGSMHWQVNTRDVTGPPDMGGLDDKKKHPGKPGPDPRDPLGYGKGGTGLLQVTIRCNNPAEAAKALKDAVSNLQPGQRDVVFLVPVRPYRNNPPNPANRDDWEVGVDW